jgi:hypothetical protein
MTRDRSRGCNETTDVATLRLVVLATHFYPEVFLWKDDIDIPY